MLQLENSSKWFKVLQDYPILQNLGNQTWRLNHLYYIKTKTGSRQLFKPNWAQVELLNNLHTCNIVLKARQLGITSLFCIYLLDQVLWNDNIQAGIIAHTLDDATNIFVDKLKFAFDNIHPALRPLFKTTGNNAKELCFTHGSVIRVGTSLRSSTLNFLHISEFGKLCAKYPEKAREVITGALNTVHPGQFIVIESTAEGREGAFYDMTQSAFDAYERGEPLGIMDYKPFFFPWWKHPEYILNDPCEIKPELEDYFAKLSIDGIALTQPQKYFYAKKYQTQQEDMLREYPSTREEAFRASQVGNWYAQQIKELYESKRVTRVTYDRALPVHTAWDLGQADAQSIWFFQINRQGEIMIIDYFERSDFPLSHTAQMLKDKGYTYGTHIWPHDAKARDRAGITFEMQAREFNLQGIILEQHSLLDGINLVRTTLSKMFFDAEKCKDGLNALSNYKKRWNSAIGGFTSDEVHDWASHGAASMRYLCAGYQRISHDTSIDNEINTLNAYLGY